MHGLRGASQQKGQQILQSGMHENWHAKKNYKNLRCLWQGFHD
jgi:hypothetical protein